MSIYKHFPDRDAVVDAAVACLYGEMNLPNDDLSTDDTIRHLAHELRRVTTAHPNLAPRALTCPPVCIEVQRSADRILSALRVAAPNDALAIGWFWMFLNYLTGAIISELAAMRNRTSGSGDDSTNAPGSTKAPGSSECPALAALGPNLAACDFAAEYEFGLETLIGSFSRPSPRKAH
jgi:AcrR family transcriptional regulator